MKSIVITISVLALASSIPLRDLRYRRSYYEPDYRGSRDLSRPFFSDNYAFERTALPQLEEYIQQNMVPPGYLYALKPSLRQLRPDDDYYDENGIDETYDANESQKQLVSWLESYFKKHGQEEDAARFRPRETYRKKLDKFMLADQLSQVDDGTYRLLQSEIMQASDSLKYRNPSKQLSASLSFNSALMPIPKLPNKVAVEESQYPVVNEEKVKSLLLKLQIAEQERQATSESATVGTLASSLPAGNISVSQEKLKQLLGEELPNLDGVIKNQDDPAKKQINSESQVTGKPQNKDIYQVADKNAKDETNQENPAKEEVDSRKGDNLSLEILLLKNENTLLAEALQYAIRSSLNSALPRETILRMKALIEKASNVQDLVDYIDENLNQQQQLYKNRN